MSEAIQVPAHKLHTAIASAMFCTREHEEEQHVFCFKIITEVLAINCLMVQESC